MSELFRYNKRVSKDRVVYLKWFATLLLAKNTFFVVFFLSFSYLCYACFCIPETFQCSVIIKEWIYFSWSLECYYVLNSSPSYIHNVVSNTVGLFRVTLGWLLWKTPLLTKKVAVTNDSLLFLFICCKISPCSVIFIRTDRYIYFLCHLSCKLTGVKRFSILV